ncbi:MAG: urate hydroxylase PuuD [Pseudomonadota bacterium]
MEALLDINWLEWGTMVLRWLHVITAIAWIGASFYFIWLDLSLKEPGPARREEGLGGELYAIHGGGIYQVGKYTSHPAQMPERLHWFKWEAYSTWLTGSALLIVIYYFRADAYLVGANLWVETPGAAIVASVVYLLAGLGLYEILMRTVAHKVWIQHVGTLVIVAVLSYLAFQLFTPRAAILHVGAALATMMAANVFLVIIPSQKAFVAAIDAGTTVDPALPANAKKRSTHNNYLTLPVLFCMLSNHSAFVYSHPNAWIFVVAFSCVAALARHYFNVKHTGRDQPMILVVAALLFVVLVAINQVSRPSASVDTTAQLDMAQVGHVVQTHCYNCHAAEPTAAGLTAPPGGMIFAEPPQLLVYREQALSSLNTQFMPLGNLTGMSDAERALLVQYLETAP